MRNQHRRAALGFFGVVVLFVGGTLVVRAISPADDAHYYVEGARPSTAARDAAWVEDGSAPSGCVPYSSDRPGAYVCGDLPPGWEPPAIPGTLQDYPEVCAVAAQIIQGRAGSLSQELRLESPFQFDPGGCQAVGKGSAEEGLWMATFPLVEQVSGSDGGPYTKVVVWNFTLDGTGSGGEPPPVVLSSSEGEGA